MLSRPSRLLIVRSGAVPLGLMQYMGVTVHPDGVAMTVRPILTTTTAVTADPTAGGPEVQKPLTARRDAG